MVKRVLLSIALAISTVAWARNETFSVPAGTTIHCRLTQTLTTGLNFQGDRFTANVSEPLMINGHEAIPAGSTLEGRISWMQRPGRIKGPGEMRLSAEKLTLPDGRTFPLNATLMTAYGAEGVKVTGEEGAVRGPTSRVKDLREVGLGMGAGGFLGTIFGGFHGAVVGGAIGGAAGLVDTLRKRGPELTLPSGTQLNYQLTRDLVIGPEPFPTPAARTDAGN